MNSKKAITLLILTTMILALVPIVSVNAIGVPVCAPTNYYKGKKVVVTGSGVTAGKTVELYWDLVQAWSSSEGAGLINSTKAKASGSYEVWFKVPEATAGDHYLWVRDTQTGNTEVSLAFTVDTYTKVSAPSGLPGDKPTVTAYGLGDGLDSAVIMGATGMAGSPITGETVVTTTVVSDLTYSFTLAHKPVVFNETISITDATETFTNNEDGTLTGDAAGTGTINYITGEVDLTFHAMAAAHAVTADYDYYVNDVDDCYIFATGLSSSALGTVTRRVTLPALSVMGYDDYGIMAYDAEGNHDEVSFAIGAVISVDVNAAPSGAVIEIRGRGFDGVGATPDVDKDQINVGDVYLAGSGSDTDVYIIDVGAGINVDSDGEFKIEVVIPCVSDIDDYDTIVVDTGYTAATEADFEVTGLAKIKLTPAYGVQGSTVTIEGWNFTQIEDEEVSVELWDDGLAAKIVDIKTFETDNAGHFKGTMIIPARTSNEYKIFADQDDYDIDDDAGFRIGMMIVILSPSSGPTGTKVTLTGTGFTKSETWNATMGDVTLWEEEDVDSDGNLEEAGQVPTFYVPTMDPGTYTIKVLDIDAEIEVDVLFTVTDTSMMELDPANGPQNYNVTISGKYFRAEDAQSLEFVIYNSTEDWDMNVYVGLPASTTAVTLDEDGNFTGWWNFNKEALLLSVGTYMINVTDGEETTYAQIPFNVVSKTVDIEPRKATFRIGDTVAFNVESSFAMEDSYIKIWDPSSSQYWKTEKFTGVWLKVGTIEIVPYYQQTAGGNPMVLLDDAPLGAWTWKMYDDENDVVDSGTFSVAAATESVLGAQIEDLNGAVTDLQTEISTVSTAMAGVQTQITNAINAANAAVQAANAATQAVNAVAQTASAASTAATNAANAATEAKNAANGLTTLVYGAIGASLVAALAAIVSLMQISRRIAG